LGSAAPTHFKMEVIPGLGHHWPGGKGLLNPRIGGTPSDAVDANSRVWEFFRSS
jgi:polyhydroxybutyrate depolymerase